MTTLVPLRPITRVKDMLESMGQELSHAYEDLIFPNHGAYLLQMGDRGRDIFVYFNQESEEKERSNMLFSVKNAGAALGLKVRYHGTYSMKQLEGEEVEIHFDPDAPLLI